MDQIVERFDASPASKLSQYLFDCKGGCRRRTTNLSGTTRKEKEQAQGLAEIRIRQLGEQMAACEKALAERDAKLMELQRFVLNIRDGWDCDEDAHRHRTLCRCCEAEKLVGPAS